MTYTRTFTCDEGKGEHNNTATIVLAAAATFFATYAIDSVLSDEAREDAIELASVLDDFNNGVTGPGHCD